MYYTKNHVKIFGIIEKLLHLAKIMIIDFRRNETLESQIPGNRSPTMKEKAVLTMIVSILAIAFCLNSFAEDFSAQVTTLEQKAQRIQSQINQAKQQSGVGMDQQVNALKSSVESLVNQRVQLDAQIARLEGQIDQIKSSAQANLDRQVAQYDKELTGVTQELAGLMAKQAAAAVQSKIVAPAPVTPQAAQANLPQTVAPQAAPAAK